MSRQQQNAFNIILRLVAVVAILLFVATCGSDDPTDPDDGQQSGGMIGPAGGTVTDGSGASVTIPAGALDREVAITVAGATGPADLPTGAATVVPLLGGAACGPDGTAFSAPVTLTIPALAPLTPGDAVPLHV
jgi:hypothetical protein